MHGTSQLKTWLAANATALLVAASAGAGTILYVDGDAPGGGDGSSWATAYLFLNDALGWAADPGHGVTEVRVAAGTYQPDRSEVSPSGSGNRSADFKLFAGVSLRGGYAGLGAADPDERDIELHATILSGDLAGNDGPSFQNIGDNSYHVVSAHGGNGADITALLAGFTVRGGNANGEGTVDPHGGGLVTMFGGGCTVVDCTFRDNRSNTRGGAMYIEDADVVLEDCLFTMNTGTIGVSIQMRGDSHVAADGCVFHNNEGFACGGIIKFNGVLELTRCEFSANVLSDGGGGLILGEGPTSIADCVFRQNHSGFIGGGITNVYGASIVNSVFSGNVASMGGGIYCDWAMPTNNCTFSGNHPQGITEGHNGSLVVTNSIVWGNTTAQIDHDPPGGWDVMPTVSSSDVQGGWSGPGSNNIDADPLFVQPGTDNLRLGFGSPCVDAGDTASLPADAMDLDGDGDTAEPLPLDLADAPRVQGASVDMGAYEGEFEVMPPAVSSAGVDQGEFVLLIPDGGAFNPLASAGMIVTNTSGPDNATVTIIQHSDNIHPQSGGYSELGVILAAESSIDDGQLMAFVFIPFDDAAIGGAEPQQVNLTWYDPGLGNWGLAVAGNTINSLGFNSPIGNRLAQVNGGVWNTSPQVGDYGVYWDPIMQHGFAWATVDHLADFAIGLALCPGDCVQTPDGTVNIVDMLSLLLAWGGAAGGGPCDLDADGAVDTEDFLGLLSAWGGCPAPSPAQMPGGAMPKNFSPLLVRTPDITGDSVVDRADVTLIRAAWGACPNCPTDLDGDGIVGAADHVLLLANWGPAPAGEAPRAAARPAP